MMWKRHLISLIPQFCPLQMSSKALPSHSNFSIFCHFSCLNPSRMEKGGAAVKPINQSPNKSFPPFFLQKSSGILFCLFIFLLFPFFLVPSQPFSSFIIYRWNRKRMFFFSGAFSKLSGDREFKNQRTRGGKIQNKNIYHISMDWAGTEMVTSRLNFILEENEEKRGKMSAEEWKNGAFW